MSIKPGKSFGKYTVLSVQNGVVTYRIDGVLTFAPLEKPIAEFAQMAGEQIQFVGQTIGSVVGGRVQVHSKRAAA